MSLCVNVSLTFAGQPMRPLSEQDIVLILESPVSDAQIAVQYGLSRQSIQKIRRGKTYADIRPDIPRRSNQSCTKCQHWHNDYCSFGFPDPVEEGPRVARYCNMYLVSSE